QIMIITGCEEGKVTDFPNWQKNLTFALDLQSICDQMYPGLMRPVYFCQRKYNMDLSPNNLLVEMGSCANTLEEAAYSGRLLGSALVKLLDSNQSKE
ncbi:MAG: stage II sporulation protein P, partial [Clostridia bacterium]|nr:stage II sporulation protein P [Clostridia bacterium]